MIKLNLPEFQHNIKVTAGKRNIFDPIRKKYVALTPEEWVRQNFINYLTQVKGYPPSLMAVEKGLKVNNMFRRSDVVLYDSSGKARLIVECKAPDIKITQETFDQAARYNLSLQVEYLIITNGMQHYCCRIDSDGTIVFLEEIPDYQQINRANG